MLLTLTWPNISSKNWSCLVSLHWLLQIHPVKQFSFSSFSISQLKIQGWNIRNNQDLFWRRSPFRGECRPWITTSFSFTRRKIFIYIFGKIWFWLQIIIQKCHSRKNMRESSWIFRPLGIEEGEYTFMASDYECLSLSYF